MAGLHSRARHTVIDFASLSGALIGTAVGLGSRRGRGCGGVILGGFGGGAAGGGGGGGRSIVRTDAGARFLRIRGGAMALVAIALHVLLPASSAPGPLDTGSSHWTSMLRNEPVVRGSWMRSPRLGAGVSLILATSVPTACWRRRSSSSPSCVALPLPLLLLLLPLRPSLGRVPFPRIAARARANCKTWLAVAGGGYRWGRM